MNYHLRTQTLPESDLDEKILIETTPAIMVGILRSMIDNYQFLLRLQEELPPLAREWGELPLQLQRLRYAIGQLMVLCKMELEFDPHPSHGEIPPGRSLVSSL